MYDKVFVYRGQDLLPLINLRLKAAGSADVDSEDLSVASQTRNITKSNGFTAMSDSTVYSETRGGAPTRPNPLLKQIKAELQKAHPRKESGELQDPHSADYQFVLEHKKIQNARGIIRKRSRLVRNPAYLGPK
jgi:hypothetical protein